MKRSAALLPLLTLGTLMLSAEAASCRPDNSNTTVTIKSKKFYCSESLDSRGCNIGHVLLKLDVESSCRSSRSVDLLCSADLEITTHSVEKLPERLTTRKRIDLDHGRASEKLLLPWRELGNAALEIGIIGAECRVDDGTVPPAPEAEREEEAETAPAALPEPADEEVSGPKTQPAPRPAETPRQEMHPEMTREAYELQLLKEQNRAKELEIKTLELRIKLKEMEQEGK